jgi:hypothetical protein
MAETPIPPTLRFLSRPEIESAAAILKREAARIVRTSPGLGCNGPGNHDNADRHAVSQHANALLEVAAYLESLHP